MGAPVTLTFQDIWDAATDDERADLLNGADKIPKPPDLFPRQALAETLSGEAGELLYGGAAGGGKTHWLIEHAIQQAQDHPGNRVLIMRRVWPSHARTIEPRMKQRLAGVAVYNGGRHEFTFPNMSIIELGTCQYADDVFVYQGAEYGCIIFEELTEFLESQYLYLGSRLRPPVDDARPHIIATTNPGGVGHTWVKSRFVSMRDADGKPRPWPIEDVWKPDPTEREPNPPTRCFVPAKLDDNPALTKRDPTYRDRLRAITNRGRREALEKGDWDAIDQVEGALWSLVSIDENRVRSVDRSALDAVVVGVDPNVSSKVGSDSCGIVVAGVAFDERSSKMVGYVLEDCTMPHPTPKAWALAAIDAYHRWEANWVVAEVNNGGDLVERNIAVEDAGVPVRQVRASRGKHIRAEPIAALATPDIDGDVRWRFVGSHPVLEDQLTTWSPTDGGASPDRLDAMVWAATELMLGGGAWSGSSNADFFAEAESGGGYVGDEVWSGDSV